MFKGNNKFHSNNLICLYLASICGNEISVIQSGLLISAWPVKKVFWCHFYDLLTFHLLYFGNLKSFPSVFVWFMPLDSSLVTLAHLFVIQKMITFFVLHFWVFWSPLVTHSTTNVPSLSFCFHHSWPSSALRWIWRSPYLVRGKIRRSRCPCSGFLWWVFRCCWKPCRVTLTRCQRTPFRLWMSSQGICLPWGTAFHPWLTNASPAYSRLFCSIVDVI